MEPSAAHTFPPAFPSDVSDGLDRNGTVALQTVPLALITAPPDVPDASGLLLSKEPEAFPALQPHPTTEYWPLDAPPRPPSFAN